MTTSEMWYNAQRDKITEYVNELKDIQNEKYPEKLEELSELRKFSLETIKNEGIFYVDKNIELMLPKYADDLEGFGIISPNNNRPIFQHRWVIPIRDTNGKVLNLVGYSPVSNERYVYGNSEVYLRRDTLYGLQNLTEAYKCGYAIMCEGITDAIALHNIGYRVAFGNCGTFRSTVSINQLERCRFGVIKIPDRDKAGAIANKEWKFSRCITMKVPLGFKDIDEVLKKEELREIVKEHIDYCIDYLRENSGLCDNYMTITY